MSDLWALVGGIGCPVLAFAILGLMVLLMGRNDKG